MSEKDRLPINDEILAVFVDLRTGDNAVGPLPARARLGVFSLEDALGLARVYDADLIQIGKGEKGRVTCVLDTSSTFDHAKFL